MYYQGVSQLILNSSPPKQLCAIMSDLLECRDDGKCNILLAFDLCAASDTVIHEPVTEDLIGLYISVGDTALEWFKSYLHNRHYHVILRLKVHFCHQNKILS